MFNLSCHILVKAGLIFRQHLQHGPQVQPPLLLRHSVSERNTHNIIVMNTSILHTTLEKQYVCNSEQHAGVWHNVTWLHSIQCSMLCCVVHTLYTTEMSSMSNLLFGHEAFLLSCWILFTEADIISFLRHVTLTQSLCALWALWQDWRTSLSSSCRSRRLCQERSQTHGLKAYRIYHLKTQPRSLNISEIKRFFIRNMHIIRVYE